MSFDEYADLFWSITDDESLSPDQQEAKIASELRARGISQLRQDELAAELVSSFLTNEPKNQ